jgi:hypothetical protein
MDWDSAQRDLELGYERAQSRSEEDLPALPAALQRGTAGSLLSPLAVQPVEVVSSEPAPAEQVARLQSQLQSEAEPDFYRLDSQPVEDPVLARLRAWRPDLKER